MTGKELLNLRESYFEMYNPERIDEDIQGMSDSELYKRSINAPTKVEKKNVNKEMKRRETLVSGRKKKPSERKFVGGKWRTVGEAVDFYDIILSHLLDEGYADTQEAAEAIMVNMSEEWRQSIVDEVITEGEKPFPYQKVDKKQASLRPNLGKDGKSFDRVVKMGMAKRRAKEAEKTGGSQQDAGKGWYHGK